MSHLDLSTASAPGVRVMRGGASSFTAAGPDAGHRAVALRCC
ncbi:MAG: hypothetical protein ACTMIR_11975 [Cellulomonadaceae bacterium]